MARPLEKIDTSRPDGRVGARLRKLRVKRKLTPGQAAAAVGVDVTTWGHWERGDRLFSARRLTAICAALKCRAEDVLG
jgi:transcriptional regulator with XRE-family HTH domain